MKWTAQYRSDAVIALKILKEIYEAVIQRGTQWTKTKNGENQSKFDNFSDRNISALNKIRGLWFVLKCRLEILVYDN